MKITRREQQGMIIYSDGTRTKKVPSIEACRKRLKELLAEAGGVLTHPTLTAFWIARANELASQDELVQAWALETFVILEQLWDELTAEAPEEDDIFSAMGL